MTKTLNIKRVSLTPVEQEEPITLGRKGRLNFVLDQELKEWAHEYAHRNHTNLTALFTSYLVKLREKENVPNVEQI